MGVLKKLTSEYFGETERKEDAVVMDGVERVDFVDNNGVRHKRGYKVVDGYLDILVELIRRLTDIRGLECDLNDIDVSNVDCMDELFDNNPHFNGDISGWDVSGVISMYRMFMNSDFNGNISKWVVSKVLDMNDMFFHSPFNGDISKWDVSNVINMNSMFYGSAFTGENGGISGWKVSEVETMRYMFAYSKFNGDVSGWDVQPRCDTKDMFIGSPLESNPPL